MEPAKFYILNLVLEKPGLYLREIKYELHSQLGIEVSEGSICTFLIRLDSLDSL